MKPHITWILVADASRASVFANAGPGKGLSHVAGEVWENKVLPSREINADRPGRSFDSHGVGRHAMEPPTDPKRHATQEFARRVAAAMDLARNAQRFDRLILVAAPAFLGDLKKELPKEVQKMVTGEIPRDLVHLKIEEIADHLGDVLAV